MILDFDLAALYGVTTKALNQAAKRNATPFPVDFMMPPEAPRREIGFHVRERPPRYRVPKRA